MNSQNKLVLENCVKRVVINCYNKEVKVLRIRNKKIGDCLKRDHSRHITKKKNKKTKPETS